MVRLDLFFQGSHGAHECWMMLKARPVLCPGRQQEAILDVD